MLCLVTSPVVGSNAHKSLCFLMLIVRLFHVEHSVAVAAGAAFAVPLPWSPGGVGARVGACELMYAKDLHIKKQARSRATESRV